ncbi:two component, sigma54 specific, transcriptional regulator, Fis family [Natronincola peptidivorans]|uniref:Stage 0 sporulation protein A homolog n=1 Tax=Natronincola peptidivorans TaxID=426128 RepID=A0A1I0BEN8_9FIRM|nr:sigma-54 dependent transcriptional regulator [Natronincola peptidivorans]SET05316.1 two component, sigma54 specific, transcriptional regulator, Fis family [Natronincola peptidivorans]
MKKILVVDDEKNMRWAIKRALAKENYKIYEGTNGLEAIEIFQQEEPDMILMDLKMPGMDGLEALAKIKELKEETPIIMITAHGTTESAVEAMKLGALDYISKPFDIEELKIVIDKALQVGELRKEVNYLREELEKNTGKTIIGNSPGIQRILGIVEKVAKTPATVLILGESGTGKEVIANTIHYSSDRNKKPYIKVNCGAIPENLMESELFGHEKGAFTGAIQRKIGKFQKAHSGTIFLDEIGELDLSMQVKLLRVLQEMEFERVGGNEKIKVDVRVIAATNRDLFKMVKEGSFREDLYYRLNVIPILIPPLRERKEDIPLLLNYFLAEFGKKIGRKNMTLDEAAREKMINYHWRGNIRELENVIERMILLADDHIIRKKSLPFEIVNEEERKDPFTLPEEGIDIEVLEKRLILQALERTDYNQTRAAQLLGMTRHTLLYRMDKYDIKKK